MADLNEREKELVAIGASIGSNCIPCIAYHVAQAREAGLSEEQIEAAIALAEDVRRVPATLVANTARAYLQGGHPAEPEPADSAAADCAAGDSSPPKCCG